MENISNRLTALMSYYGLSASALAEKTGVQRSGISHLLSGRNKPSLDFITKTVDVFPEVNLYWLIQGKGTMFRTSTSESTAITSSEPSIHEKLPSKTESDEKNVQKIVIFYTDGTFTTHNPR